MVELEPYMDNGRQNSLKVGDRLRKIPPPPPVAEVIAIDPNGWVDLVWPSGIKYTLSPSQLKDYELVFPE